MMTIFCSEQASPKSCPQNVQWALQARRPRQAILEVGSKRAKKTQNVPTWNGYKAAGVCPATPAGTMKARVLGTFRRNVVFTRQDWILREEPRRHRRQRKGG